MKIIIKVLLSSLSLLIYGCSIPASVRLGPFYAPPKVAEEPAAFLTGTGRNNMLATAIFSAFPFAVDNIRVENATDRWSIPLPILPGRRVITAEFNYGNRYARTDLEIMALDGQDYVIKFTTDAGLPRGDSFCEFWIEDAKSGTALTTVMRENLLKK